MSDFALLYGLGLFLAAMCGFIFGIQKADYRDFYQRGFRDGLEESRKK